ncbi:hypothetical protein SAMN05216466_10698 [Paraburkholderia phenazinium]|uniref:Uncharacterized protein n=1 Tax=Paraburkholderia phenazinium TaxID=60549 RepID=A0A1G7YA26_9BURK|nr:hypothetical protein [Paraburkholderia phenazinium]SDG93209.1 hypothetical protein SAMN05216466_10698 [Paraburkholderia phenazinium]
MTRTRTLSSASAIVTTKPGSPLRMSHDHMVIRVPIDVTLADGSQYSVQYHSHAGKEHTSFDETFGDHQGFGDHEGVTNDAYRLLERLVEHTLHNEDHLMRDVLQKIKAVGREAIACLIAEVNESVY